MCTLARIRTAKTNKEFVFSDSDARNLSAAECLVSVGVENYDPAGASPCRVSVNGRCGAKSLNGGRTAIREG